MAISLFAIIVTACILYCHFALALSVRYTRSRQFACWKKDDRDTIGPAMEEDSFACCPLTRRYFATRMIALGTCFIPGVSIAKEWSLDTDKKNLVEGHRRLTYLLDNWESETTVCGRSDNPYVTDAGCERTPLKVMDYLGYRNTNHPLFKAEKMLQRLESLVPPENEAEYLEAIEKWVESADEGNGMAYISSWGEANPGGGKDRVLLFIQRAKKSVVEARDSLATAIRILDLSR